MSSPTRVTPCVARKYTKPFTAAKTFSDLIALYRLRSLVLHTTSHINAHDDVTLRLAERLDEVNQHVTIGPHIPMAGSKQSGLGVEQSTEGLAEFSRRLQKRNSKPRLNRLPTMS